MKKLSMDEMKKILGGLIPPNQYVLSNVEMEL